MDREGIVKQQSFYQAAKAAHEAATASEARTEAIVEIIPDDQVRRARIELTKELVNRLERLNGLPISHPVVVSSEAPDRVGDSTVSTKTFDIGGAQVKLTKSVYRSEAPAYGLSLAGDEGSAYASIEYDRHIVSPGSFDFGRLNGDIDSPSYSLGYDRSMLREAAKCADNVAILEEACGLSWPPSPPTQEQVWLGQILLVGEPARAA